MAKRKHDLTEINETTECEVKKEGGLFNSLDQTPNFIGNHSSRNNKINGNFRIDTLNTLNELVEEERASLSNDKPVTLRFLLTPTYELLFAPEGLPSKQIPPHFAMTDKSQIEAKCITAGNVKINKEGEIVYISNKSGDFTPFWDSLQFGISALLACNANFAETIKIKQSTVSGEINVYTYTLDSIKKELNSLTTQFPIEEFQKINANLGVRMNSYPKKNNQAQEEIPVAKITNSCRTKLSFSNASDNPETKGNSTTGLSFFSDHSKVSKNLFKDYFSDADGLFSDEEGKNKLGA
ncbi:MAG: hypothetical protein H0U57_02410 [Tatlockia sp.]|nr:hypothetical protein [Tatlockia sp.]